MVEADPLERKELRRIRAKGNLQRLPRTPLKPSLGRELGRVTFGHAQLNGLYWLLKLTVPFSRIL